LLLLISTFPYPVSRHLDVPTGKASALGIRFHDSLSYIFCGGAGVSKKTMEVISHDREEKNSSD
jgi:hypothetical protein